MSRPTFPSLFVTASIAAIALGCIVRARPVLLADFPLNDGGLFYLMTEELQHNHYRLPAFTAYNAAQIPFAYPPVGFYVAGLLADIASVDLMHVFRLLPLATTCATLIAFLFLARSMLVERVAVVAAVTAFALAPRSFVWLVMGGGLTRAFGFLFTILALHQAYLLFTRRQLRFAVSAGVFAGLTPMSHLGTAPFVAASLVLFFLAYGRHRQGLIGAAVIGLVALAVSAPWWASVAAEHGFGPFAAAGQTGGSILTPGALRRTVIGRLVRFGMLTAGEPLFPVIAVLALFGSLATLVRRAALVLPIWWLVTLALDARAGPTYATLPISLLAGIGFRDVLLPLLKRPLAGGAPERSWPSWPAAGGRIGRPMSEMIPVHVRQYGFATVVTGFLVLYCTLAALTRNGELGTEAAYLASLSHDERDAMSWVAANTPPSSRFFVVPEEGWSADKVAEWFPVLARRTSVATVQGTEWLPGRAFARHDQLYKDAIRCAGRDAQCVEQWSSTAGIGFSHVFIPKAPGGACCRQLSSSLRADARYTLLFDGPGAEVFARR